MAFEANLEIKEGIGFITLSGSLDASAAGTLQKKIEAAAAEKVARLVLMMKELSFMASAGLRMMIFAKQKMGKDVDVYVIAAQPMVLETLKKTGFDKSVIIQDEYQPID
jgi:anti-anti-sigma factor